MKGRPLRAGVLVDLAPIPEAGGHVKSWERLAEAAAALPDELDLTVHFSGSRDDERTIASNVRYVLHRRVLGTEYLPCLADSPDHTDLSPHHPGLARHLRDYDVVHATDAYFAFARTALRFTQRRHRPLVSSTHTDTPRYAPIFARRALRRAFGRTVLGRTITGLLADRLALPDRIGRRLSRELDRYLSASAFVLASSEEDLARARRLLPEDRIGRLRRGIDKDLFNPARRDRAALARRFGVPQDRLLLVYVGRIDPSKSPLVLAEAARRLLAAGRPVHVLFSGRGALRGPIVRSLEGAVTFTGPVAQEDLPLVYAGADVFVFPSTTEIAPNVVVEAKACGSPAVVSARGGSPSRISAPGTDGLVIGSEDPADWAAAIDSLLTDPARRTRMSRAARRHIERAWPSWHDVLREDLLPAWRRAAGWAALSRGPA